MTTKHTPGPWTADFLTVRTYRPDGSGSKQVAHCGTAGGDVGEESYNARLISAAPDLLAILKEVVSDCAIVELMRRSDCADCQSPLTRAKAAIRKAEGRS